jgi:hypothetical protein
VPPLTRSKDELARIVALLESDVYDTEEQLAYAVLKEAADILADRHLIVVWSRSHPDVLWGPYYTEKQAETAWADIGPLLGAEGGALLRVAPWPAVPAVYRDKDYYPLSVCICGHPRWKHTNSGKKNYCGSRKDGCKCGGFTHP